MYDTLILSGGAAGGYYQLGYLFRHWDNVKSTKKYIGCSVGAIISLMIICGWSPVDVLRISTKVKKEDFVWSISAGVRNHGLSTINPYISVLRKEVLKRYGSIPTLGELHKMTGKHLIVVGSDIAGRRAIYIDHIGYPNMLCTTAVDISSRIPIIFSPISYDDMLLLDGGICDHFPVSQYDGKTLAIYIKNGSYDPKGDIVSFVWSLIDTAVKHRYIDVTHPDGVSVVIIEGKGDKLFPSPVEILTMFIEGYITR